MALTNCPNSKGKVDWFSNLCCPLYLKKYINKNIFQIIFYLLTSRPCGMDALVTVRLSCGISASFSPIPLWWVPRFCRWSISKALFYPSAWSLHQAPSVCHLHLPQDIWSVHHPWQLARSLRPDHPMVLVLGLCGHKRLRLWYTVFCSKEIPHTFKYAKMDIAQRLLFIRHALQSSHP